MRNVVGRLRSRGLVTWVKGGRSYDVLPTPGGLLRAHADLTSYRLANPEGPIEGVDSLLFALSYLLEELYGKAVRITRRRMAEGARVAGKIRQQGLIHAKSSPKSRPQYFKRTDATRQALLETRVTVPYFLWDDKQRGGSKSLKDIVNESRLRVAKSIDTYETRFPYTVPKRLRTNKPSSNPLFQFLLKKASRRTRAKLRSM